jgi:hypothetical protein
VSQRRRFQTDYYEQGQRGIRGLSNPRSGIGRAVGGGGENDGRRGKSSVFRLAWSRRLLDAGQEKMV